MTDVMRHEYKALSDEEQASVRQIKDMGRAFVEALDGLGQARELSLAKTKVEEAVMWAVKFITAP